MAVLQFCRPGEIVEPIQRNLPDGQITSDFQKSKVKPWNQKYFASLPTQISSLIRTVLFRQEGRCARHETRGGMRWTRRRQASNSEPDV
jgi:hypothetical protein